MRNPLRVILILAGTVLFLITGFIVYFFLSATNIITFTKRTQSIQLPSGRVLNIYRTSTFEYYECKFELREGRNGKALIPQEAFHTDTYWSSKVGNSESTPEGRTTFVPLSGAKSGVVGLVSSADTSKVLLLVDVASLEFVASISYGVPEEKSKLAEKLLAGLKGDYPDRDLVLPGTRGAAMLQRKHDIERFRQTFERVDAAIKLGTTLSNALAVSWKPVALVTNNNGNIEAQFVAEPSHTCWGQLKTACGQMASCSLCQMISSSAKRICALHHTNFGAGSISGEVSAVR
jgi:hypothetical protein